MLTLEWKEVFRPLPNLSFVIQCFGYCLDGVGFVVSYSFLMLHVSLFWGMLLLIGENYVFFQGVGRNQWLRLGCATLLTETAQTKYLCRCGGAQSLPNDRTSLGALRLVYAFSDTSKWLQDEAFIFHKGNNAISVCWATRACFDH